MFYCIIYDDFFGFVIINRIVFVEDGFFGFGFIIYVSFRYGFINWFVKIWNCVFFCFVYLFYDWIGVDEF